MTVSYSSKMSDTKFGAFLKLLLRWRGSLYKLLWRELLVFLILYYAINFVYRFWLNDNQKGIFEEMALYCEKYANNIPLTFVLGFYVSTIYDRWWEQFGTVAWPDRLAYYIHAYIRGSDDHSRMLRRTTIRYANLCAVMGLRLISMAVYKRYPTMQHLVDAGFLRPDELELLEGVKSPYPKEYIPCLWAATYFVQARREGLIDNDRALLELLKEMNDIRQTIRSSRYYNWISVPLVYTQVITIAVYTFFVSCLIGRQQLDQKHVMKVVHIDHGPDIYFPAFTILQLIIYIGWLKVAEVMMNPYGEDDDDFEMTFILQRNLETSYVIVDETVGHTPELKADWLSENSKRHSDWTKHVFEEHTESWFEQALSGYFGSTAAKYEIFPESPNVISRKENSRWFRKHRKSIKCGTCTAQLEPQGCCNQKPPKAGILPNLKLLSCRRSGPPQMLFRTPEENCRQFLETLEPLSKTSSCSNSNQLTDSVSSFAVNFCGADDEAPVDLSEDSLAEDFYSKAAALSKTRFGSNSD